MISIEVNSYNKSYFTRSYEKYNIESVTSKSSEELNIITIDLIKYLKGQGGNELLKPHFNEREILHMEDVQHLFDLARIVKYISTIISILILLYFLRKKEILTLGKTLFYGIFLNYALIALLGILIVFDFR